MKQQSIVFIFLITIVVISLVYPNPAIYPCILIAFGAFQLVLGYLNKSNYETARQEAFGKMYKVISIIWNVVLISAGIIWIWMNR